MRTSPRRTGPRSVGRPAAVRRARRLHWRLATLFALTSAVGLIGLAGFAVHNDDASRRRQLDTDLKLQIAQAISGLGYDDKGRLDVGALDDYVETSCPSLFVLSSSGGGLEPAFTPRQPCAHAAADDVKAIAAEALQQETRVLSDARGTDGHPLRLAAGVFAGSDGEGTSGAIVAAGDLTTGQAAHRDLAVW